MMKYSSLARKPVLVSFSEEREAFENELTEKDKSWYKLPDMEREQQKPDAVVRVNDFDITIYRRGQGLRIDVAKEGVEVGFFGISGTPLANQEETSALPVSAPAPTPVPDTQGKETPAPVAPLPAATSEVRKEPNQPVKIVGM